MRFLGRLAIVAAAFSLVAPMSLGPAALYGTALAADAAKPDKPGKSSKSDRSANQSKSKAKSGRSLRDMAKTAKAKADAKARAKAQRKSGASARRGDSRGGRAVAAFAAAEVADDLLTGETPVIDPVIVPPPGEVPPGEIPVTEVPVIVPVEVDGPIPDTDDDEVPTEVDGPVPDTPQEEVPTEVDGPVPETPVQETPVQETPTPVEQPTPTTPQEETPTQVDGPTPSRPDPVTPGQDTASDDDGPERTPTTQTPTAPSGGSGGGSQVADDGGSGSSGQGSNGQGSGGGSGSGSGSGSGGSQTATDTTTAPGSGSQSGSQSGSKTEVVGGGPSTGGKVPSESSTSSGPTETVSAPSIKDLLGSIFGGRPRTPREPAATPAPTPAPAPVEVAVVEQPAVAPLAPAPVEAAPVQTPAVAPQAVAKPVEPAIAKTAPRIELSSGNSRQKYRQYEITALGLTRESRQVANALGFRILSERKSPLLGNRVVARLRTPSGQTADAALKRIRSILPEVTFDYAHLYRPSGEGAAPVRYAAAMIGAPADQPGSCKAASRVGLIDSGVGSHETLASAKVVRKNFVDRNAATNVAHGTAIASILVGDLPGSGPLLSGAQLYSANVFAQDGAGLRADPTAIIEALDWMAQNRVPVVNLSLMGPENALLTQAVQAATRRGLVLVAAAGNDGPSGAPAYPAAYSEVIAVSAVDSRGRPYARNNRGNYIYVAAPGVDVWGADARGGLAFWTGTSFAAPFVTASIARDMAQGRVANINDGRKRLAATARDMGAPGRDPIYGYGLLQLASCGSGGLSAPVISSKSN